MLDVFAEKIQKNSNERENRRETCGTEPRTKKGKMQGGLPDAVRLGFSLRTHGAVRAVPVVISDSCSDEEGFSVLQCNSSQSKVLDLLVSVRLLTKRFWLPVLLSLPQGKNGFGSSSAG